MNYFNIEFIDSNNVPNLWPTSFLIKEDAQKQIDLMRKDQESRGRKIEIKIFTSDKLISNDFQ